MHVNSNKNYDLLFTSVKTSFKVNLLVSNGHNFL